MNTLRSCKHIMPSWHSAQIHNFKRGWQLREKSNWCK